MRTVRINIWQGEAAPLRAVARKELHVWSVFCSHWVAAGPLWSSQLLPLNLACVSLWSYSGSLLPTSSAEASRDAGAHGGRKEPCLVQERSIMLQVGSQLVFSKRKRDQWPHLSRLWREQSIPSDLSWRKKIILHASPVLWSPCREARNICLQRFLMQIWFVTAKMCTFCVVYIWRIVVLDKLSSLPSKITYSLILLSNFKDRLRGWKCQYVINFTVASSWHQSFRWRAVIKWSSLKLQQVQGRYSTSFTVSSGKILRWDWWTLVDCLITPMDWVDEITCPCKVACSHSFLSCHSCSLCKK